MSEIMSDHKVMTDWSQTPAHKTSQPHMVAVDFPPLATGATAAPLSATTVVPLVSAQQLRTHEEEIYEDLCYVTLRLGRDRERVLGSIPLEPIEKRDYCVKELVETEKNYCEALNMIVNQFIQPLSKVLRTSDRNSIFMHIKHLYDIHSRFYTDLCHSCQASTGAHTPSVQMQCQTNSTPTLSSTPCTPSTTTSSACNATNGHNNHVNGVHNNNFKISSSFIQFKDKFVVYGEYCSNLPKAQTLIDTLCQKDELIAQSVHKCQLKANDGKFKLRDLLSLPMQRILKYHLLLSQLIKTTVDTHEDYSGLQRAHQAMVDIGQYINEVKRDTETLGIITDIQASITDLDMPENTELKDYGRLLKDGELKIRSHEENRLKNRYIFVFDKVMLMCKSIRGEQYSYKEALILADYQIEEQSISSTISKLTKQWTNGWNLVHRQHKKTYVFYAKTDDIKNKWIEAINKALDNDCPQACREGYTDHTFAMFTFPTITTCVGCDQLLKGIFFQGYQCTVCHIGVHKDCIQSVPSCGAPSLPPRPPLPPSSPGLSLNSFTEEDSVSNGGTCDTGVRQSYESPTSLGVFDGNHQQTEEQVLNLEDYDWFAGPLDRESAQSTLQHMNNGSFLVRISPKQRGSYAISLNYSGQVKHMRVQQRDDNQYYYLSESRYFATIADLVVYYESNSLCESFNLVDTNLMTPYKKALNASAVAYAIALYSFTGSSANLLDLRKGDRVAVLSKAGESKGWWKGQIADRIGYFPLAYVTQTQHMS
ncbi:unnamed protein product [Medioppia subpectinata]|uniref:Uncharacterized protein n=1 Tax=Medioppia subpectinata TaxID=1979941 RepID=A0A7R9Q3B5_9ACAR|nr:unnamed protein product [Medioppia subpectinata]CAG2110284.1 unnamed protein product [Medioppia subpectinata]